MEGGGKEKKPTKGGLTLPWNRGEGKRATEVPIKGRGGGGPKKTVWSRRENVKRKAGGYSGNLVQGKGVLANRKNKNGR